MRHTRIIVTHYGGPDALRVVEEECPEPKDASGNANEGIERLAQESYPQVAQLKQVKGVGTIDRADLPADAGRRPIVFARAGTWARFPPATAAVQFAVPLPPWLPLLLLPFRSSPPRPATASSTPGSRPAMNRHL